MLLIRNGEREEYILESNYEKNEEQNGLALNITFDSFEFAENIGHELIDFNLLVEDLDGHQYVIKKMTEYLNRKQVSANHIYFELIGFRKYTDFSGTRTFNEFANWLFESSGWTFINRDVNSSATFNSFGNDNFLQLMQRLTTKFDCEFKVLPNKVIEFAQRIGSRNEKQFRYGNNIQSISRSIDTSNVRTRIIATGANDISTLYISPLADNPIFGILDAEPVRDNNIDNYADLQEFAMNSLKDYPDMNLEISVVDIDGEVGDYVYVIYEPLNIDIETRILSKITRREYNESTIQLGNTKIRTIEDALIDQKEGIKENQEAIEETNETIVETEENLRSEIIQTEENLRSEIIQTSSTIRLEVQQVSNSVASLEITANQIQSNVTNLQNSTQSSITQLSDNINLKVDKGGVITDINLTPGTATINAEKINLNGAVMVNGSISGSTDIIVSNSAAIGNALYFGGFRGSVDFIEVSGGDMSFNSFGDFMFSGGSLYVNGKRVLTE